MIDPSILATATAVPPHVLGQADVARIAPALMRTSPETLERLLPVFASSGIATRYSCLPIEDYAALPGPAARNALYLEHAVALLAEAASTALARAGVAPEAVDAIVTVSTTGIATPSLDARLMGRLRFRDDVERMPLFGLGCAGGVLGLARAASLARARPGSRVLLLVVELCALSFRRNDGSKSNVVATALFGDGAAAVLLSSDARDGRRPRVAATGEHTWPRSLDVMGWEVEDDGWKAIFSRDIPALVRSDMRDVAVTFLRRHGLALADIAAFACHPGGAKVIVALEEAFGLDAGALATAREVLRDFGNMSAATVLFVLDRMLRTGLDGRTLVTAMGPGFTAGFAVVEPA